MITNTFEYSLQRVNPKLTVPYWDWTIEGVEAGIATSTDEADIEINSPLFQDSWFGAADPDDYVVSETETFSCRAAGNSSRRVDYGRY